MAGAYRFRRCFAHRSDLWLQQGKVYFSVQFADEDMLIPIMETCSPEGISIPKTQRTIWLEGSPPHNWRNIPITLEQPTRL